MSLRDDLNAAFGDPERFRLLIDSNWPAIDAALEANERLKTQASDLVERLRHREKHLGQFGPDRLLFEEAADEIHRLRTSCGHCGELEAAFDEIERLRSVIKALQKAYGTGTVDDAAKAWAGAREAMRAGREA